MSDLISRQDAIDEIEMLLEQSEDDKHDKIWNDAIRGSISVIKHHVPSAQKKGKWNDIGGILRWGCPLCYHVYEFKENFCPNCGADMRGEKDVRKSN